ncbi:MAG: hypothetical protein MUF07_18990 [Steroidobacteraceae bacterium]|nr:hypothetical protein [Steroidobacteraceae bacterium]
MAHTLIDRDPDSGFSFDAATCEVSHPGGGPPRTRLVASAPRGAAAAEERILLLDFVGSLPSPRLPQRLEAVRVVPEQSAGGWRIDSAQGRFLVAPARLFVHEDVSVRAAKIIPPRPVPLARRAFWRIVFALLATPVGRRWLERRAAAR